MSGQLAAELTISSMYKLQAVLDRKTMELEIHVVSDECIKHIVRATGKELEHQFDDETQLIIEVIDGAFDVQVIDPSGNNLYKGIIFPDTEQTGATYGMFDYTLPTGTQHLIDWEYQSLTD